MIDIKELANYKGKSGIYKIINTINNKFYIGSTKDFYYRIHLHKSHLNSNKHDNQKLQNSWNKYGEINFVFEIIEECAVNNLIEKEQSFINKLVPYFNIRKIANSNLGFKHSKESKLKISKVQMIGPIYEYNLNGKYLREWSCAREASAGLGYTYSSVNFNLNGKFNKCLNSIFRFEKFENIPPYIYKNKNQGRKRFIIKKDKKGNTLEIYKNSKECGNKLGYSHKTITGMINHKTFIKKDYILEYGENY